MAISNLFYFEYLHNCLKKHLIKPSFKKDLKNPFSNKLNIINYLNISKVNLDQN